MNSGAPLIILFALFFSLPVISQTIETFDGDDLGRWTSQGDGESLLDPDFGNPGGSMAVQDDATGSLNVTIAPRRYLGNWSAANSTDSLSVDYFVSSSRTDSLTGEVFIFEISGPGGRATALDGLHIEPGQWVNVTTSLNPEDWSIQEGTWAEILQRVDLFRIRAEFIIGGEVVHLDNIRLDIEPSPVSINRAICTSFDDGSLEGWRFEGAGATRINDEFIDSLLVVQVRNRANDKSRAIAPPKFLGDWTTLLDSGYIEFDLYVQGSGAFQDKDFLIQISNETSSAFLLPENSELEEALNQWKTYRFYVQENDWTVTAGTWENLISNVNEVRLDFEMLTAAGTSYFDDFCISPAGQTVSTHLTRLPDDAVTISPNPSKGHILLEAEDQTILKYRILTLLGRQVAAHSGLNTSAVSVETDFKGLAILIITTREGQIAKRVIFH